MVRKMTPIERAKALGMLSAGLMIKEVAEKMGRAKSSIHALKEKHAREGSVRAVKTSPGRGRKNLASLAQQTAGGSQQWWGAHKVLIPIFFGHDPQVPLYYAISEEIYVEC